MKPLLQFTQRIFDLGLRYVCIMPTLNLIMGNKGIKAAFSRPSPISTPIVNCNDRFSIIPVALNQEFGATRFIDGYTYLLIDTALNTIEWIIPYTFTLNPIYEKSMLTALSISNIGTGYKFIITRPQDMSQMMLEYPQFSVLYYLETVLQNPQHSRDNILLALRKVTQQTIHDYRHTLLPEAYPNNVSSNEKIGVIFCHGKEHGFDMIADWIPRDARWWTLDANADTNPDVVGNYTSEETLAKLGLFKWDYVLFQHCPLSMSRINTQMAIRAARRLLKPGGKLLYPKAISSTWLVHDFYNLGIRRENVNDFLSDYDKRKLPQVNMEFLRMSQEEYYSQYIPFRMRDIVMVV